jgi:hypothetical protein
MSSSERKGAVSGEKIFPLELERAAIARIYMDAV